MYYEVTNRTEVYLFSRNFYDFNRELKYSTVLNSYSKLINVFVRFCSMIPFIRKVHPFQFYIFV